MTAWARPSGSRYSAEPATSTLAPAAAAPWMVAGADAAVDLDVDVVAALEHEVAELGDLRLHGGDVGLAAEAGVHGHHQHHVDEVEHVLHRARPAWPG